MAKINQKTIDTISNILENINYNYNRFCTDIYDISSIYTKSLSDAMTYAKGMRIGMGIHGKQTRKNYEDWYKGKTPKANNRLTKLLYAIPTSYPASLYRQAAHKLAYNNIKIDNVDKYKMSQLEELSKITTAGYDVSRLTNPDFSAADIRIMVPYLNRNITLEPDVIRDLRRQEYKSYVVDFFETVMGAEIEGQTERSNEREKDANETSVRISKELKKEPYERKESFGVEKREIAGANGLDALIAAKTAQVNEQGTKASILTQEINAFLERHPDKESVDALKEYIASCGNSDVAFSNRTLHQMVMNDADTKILDALYNFYEPMDDKYMLREIASNPRSSENVRMKFNSLSWTRNDPARPRPALESLINSANTKASLQNKKRVPNHISRPSGHNLEH